MLIEKRTPAQIALQEKIQKILHPRPQMPIGILSGIVGIREEEAQKLVDDLEYRGAIEKRVTRDFLTESECNTIQLIQEEISKRLSSDKIGRMSIGELENMLKSAMERKKILDQNPSKPAGWGGDAKSYIDELLKSSSTEHDEE